MSYSFHRGAELDLAEAVRFYRREGGSRLARRFLDEFERVMHLLEQYPDIGTRSGGNRRSLGLAGFPYSVIYRHAGPELRVLVVRHRNRDPEHGEQRS